MALSHFQSIGGLEQYLCLGRDVGSIKFLRIINDFMSLYLSVLHLCNLSVLYLSVFSGDA